MLKKHGAALNFACVEMRTTNQQMGYPEALADPEGLVWQVCNMMTFPEALQFFPPNLSHYILLDCTLEWKREEAL